MVAAHVLVEALSGGRPPPHPLRATAPAIPWLSPRGWARGALWLGERALEPATEYERDMLDEAAQLAGVVVVRRAIDPAPRGSDARLDIAELAKKVAEDVASALPQYAQDNARRLATAAARLVRAPEALARALDDELYCIEADELVVAHGGPATGVEAALYRAEGKRDRLGMCVVRRSDSYGIVCKLKGRYHWFEGGRADVLATIPDAVLSDAIDIITACEQRRRA